MKAKSVQINALKSQLQKDFDAVVLYGNDPGELNHTFIQIKRILNIPNDAFHLITPSKEDLKKTPFLATDEANTPSLIAGKRFIVIGEDVPFDKAALLHFLENKKTDAFLIVQGGNLTKTNSLRVEADKNPHVLSLACYQPSEKDIQKMVMTFFYENKKTISQSVLSELCKKISFNQQVVLQELEKLLLFLGDKPDISLADVQAVLTDGAETNLENLSVALANGNIEQTSRLLNIFLSQNEPATLLFKAVRDYFGLLLKIVSDENGPTFAIDKNLRPDQKFRISDAILTQAKRWAPENILFILDKILQLEIKTRTTGLIPETMISHSFLSMASFAKKLPVLR
ncbi:MAG: DNA polymerase III subunit delta [Alphaproteobacteria bacterium]|nr:DNA polymerase III subunit delta [Alphaproteobacteria bacterium]MBQ4471705.1 DNA polymerase III subunit delta [Alphaproteobacteria bacterium]